MSLVGSVGQITIPTRGEAGMGEAELLVNGCRGYYIAWSAAPLAQGQRVLVIGTRGAMAVDVEPWDDFGAIGP